MKEEVSFLRHSAWVSPESLTDKITIIGCGATGSNMALIAARMGFTKFDLWDADNVESHNLPNQVFFTRHIYQNKAEALAEILKEFNPRIEVTVHKEFFYSEQHKDSISGILILTVDSNSARKDIYKSFHQNSEIEYVIETKMGWDYAELHLIDNLNSEHCEKWLKSLKDDKDIPDGPCNLRICTTLVTIVSSYAIHSLCAKYAARNTGEAWVPDKLTMFELSPKLSVYKIK